MSAVTDATLYLLQLASGAPADTVKIAALTAAIEAETTVTTSGTVAQPGFEDDSPSPGPG